MAFDVDDALMRVIENEGSDLHIKVPSRPLIRRHGKLEPLEGEEPLTPEVTEQVLSHMLTNEAKLQEFEEENEVDFSYSLPGVARFRVNAFRQRGSISLVCRAIPFQIKTAEELMLPPVINDLADEERGIILLTGTTGSGKSTTLAAMIDRMNSRSSKHIVTIEDPIEFLHRDKHSIINQREVGDDTASFARALRRVLRQDPDVILIGEMRDEETVRTALTAAETGRVRDMIMNADETGRLPEAISEGAYYGMQTFDQALLEHVREGRVSMEEALKAATHPHDFKLLIHSDGQRSTSVEQVLEEDGAHAAA